MIKRKIEMLLLFGLLATPLSGYAHNEFQQGTIAFRDGQYLQALEAFQAAERKGDTSPTLTYNTGLTYYKLGRYQQAAATFQRLAQSPEWRDLANFHLGLVAEKQGNSARAITLYRELERDAPSDKLRKLAAARLVKLDAQPSTASQRSSSTTERLSAVFNVTAGTDGNAFSLQDDVQLQSSAGEDRFNEFFAWGQYYLSGSSADGWRLHGFAYARRYGDFDSLDINASSAGLSRHQRHQVWQSEFGLAAVTTELDGNDLTDQSRFVARFQRPLNASWLSLVYTPSRHDGGKEFSHLDGWQHKAEARWRFPRKTVSFDFGYHWEFNDRDDLSQDGNFFSYSPMRHTLAAGLDWRVLPSWEISVDADYRISHYDGTNRLVDSDGIYKEKTREADRLKLRLKTQWQLSQNLRVAGQLELIDNQENFDTYSYDKTEMSFMVEYLL